jgi:tetratricopeptide (TPR) repeat protein
MQFCQSGLSLATSIGSAKRQSQTLQQLAWIKIDSGDFPGAKEDASESQKAAKIAGNLQVEATALYVEAICWQYLGSYSHCISLLDRATHLLDLCGLSGSVLLHSSIQTSQAEVHRCKSEYAEAHKIQTQILHSSSADQGPIEHAFALLNIAQINIEMEASAHDVLQNIDTAALLVGRVNYSSGLTICDMFRAALEVQQGNLPAARMLFQKCLQSAWGKDTEAVTYCLEKLASVHQWSPMHQRTFACTVTFLVHSAKCKQKLELHKALQFLGEVFQAHGDQETAITLFTVALNGFTQMDVHRSRAECMVHLGDISQQSGDTLKAVGLWEKARPLFERSSQTKQLAHLEAKITSVSRGWPQKVEPETLDQLANTHAPSGHLRQLSSDESHNPENITVEHGNTTALGM